MGENDCVRGILNINHLAMYFVSHIMSEIIFEARVKLHCEP